MHVRDQILAEMARHKPMYGSRGTYRARRGGYLIQMKDFNAMRSNGISVMAQIKKDGKLIFKDQVIVIEPPSSPSPMARLVSSVLDAAGLL